MANLYITEQGAVLRKSGDRLVVTKQKATLLEVPCHRLEAVLLFGNVQFTSQAVRELFDHGIEMALLTLRGKLIGQITSPTAKNVELRLSQYRCSQDPAFVLSVSRIIVRAKLANGLALLRRFTYNHPEVAIDAEARELRRAITRVEQIGTVAELLGIEGGAARAYFAAFGRMLPASFAFTGRRKRPAPDPVNALLSFGYTLLFNEMASLLDGIGFDPHLGFLHRPAYGRASLAADLIEELRAPVIDRLTLRLVNRRQLTEDDFYRHENSGSVFLRRESLRKYFTAYEELLGEPQSGFDGEQVRAEAAATAPGVAPDPAAATTAAAPAAPEEPGGTPPQGQAGTWRSVFRRQAYAMATALTGGGPYLPVTS